MPTASQNAKRSSGNLSLLVIIASGVFAFATISFVISRFGVQPIPTLLFSGLSGLAVAAFVSRERNLLKQLETSEQNSAAKIADLQNELSYLHGSSIISLIEYDAGNLIVGSASSGFYQLMGFESNRELEGEELSQLLGAEVSELEQLTERVKRGSIKGTVSLNCRRAGGDALELKASGRFIEDRYMIELCLVCSPGNFEKYAELQQMMEDLERFRKGMLRREERIIDLKNEVNGLMKELEMEPRYAVTAAAESGRIADMLTELKESKGTHE